MPDNRPRPRDRKLKLIAPLTLVAAVVAVLAVAYLLNERRPPTVEPSPAPAIIAPPTATAPPPLSRADLVAAANRAAAAFTAPAGAHIGDSETILGREFRLRIAFGCDGGQSRPLGAQAFAEYDPTGRSVRLVAQPASWTGLPLVEAIEADGKVEAVEGFWLPRPWSAAEGCPPKRDYAAAPTPTPAATQTLGVAQAFEIGGSRLLRRGDRPYAFVRRIPAGDTGVLTHSYWLVLEGQVTGFGPGDAFQCWQESAEHRPICLVGVNFSRVAFEDAVTSEVLAEWRE